MSGIRTWFVAFYEDYISLNMKDYPNLGFDFEIVKVLLIAAVVLCVVFCVMDFHKKNAYLIIKQLMRHEAKNPESAKTLSELSLSENRAVRRSLASSSQIRSVVGRVGEKELTYEEYIANEKRKKELKRAKRALKKTGAENISVPVEEKTPMLDELRFYIKEERADYASKIYNGADISVLRTVLRCVLVVAVAVCFVFLMPELLSFINNIMG